MGPGRSDGARGPAAISVKDKKAAAGISVLRIYRRFFVFGGKIEGNITHICKLYLRLFVEC